MQSKNTLISFLQTFGILLVVVGHSFYGCGYDSVFYTWIYSFHMPLFMFISGYLLRYETERKKTPLAETSLYGRDGFIFKKVKRLLVPYVVISTLTFFPKTLLNSFAARPTDISLPEYIKMLIYPWDNVIIFFWFLPTLFLIFLIAVYGARLQRYAKCPIQILLLCTLLAHLFNPVEDVKVLNIGGVVGYLFYFALGYYVCRGKIEQKFENTPIYSATFTLLLSIFFISIPGFFGKDVLTAVNGIAMSISLGYIYTKRGMGFFHHLFGASYAIYLFSWYPQVLSQQVFLKLTDAPWQVATGLAIVSGVYVPFYIYKWIVKNKSKKYGKVIALLAGQ